MRFEPIILVIPLERQIDVCRGQNYGSNELKKLNFLLKLELKINEIRV